MRPPARTKLHALRTVACVAAAALTACVAVVVLSSRSSTARAASIGQLQQQISAGQGTISNLSGAVSAASSRLAQLGSSIAGLQRQIARIQADLDAKRAELLKLRAELDAARARLAQLEAYEAHAEAVLSQQLVNSYESGSPDLVHVVLESTGFQDLLERLSFMRRVQRQNAHVISEVRAARRAVAAQATRLGALELRQQRLTVAVLAQRNSLASTRVSLVQQQLTVARARQQKAGQLTSARGRVADLERKLSAAQAAQAAQAARAAAAASTQSSSASSGSPNGSSSAPSAPSSGSVSSSGFAFPLPKGSASPPGSWSLDDGVDISAPGDTPEYAVCSGTIVLHGIGGFGPSAPVLHCDSAVGGYSYVYYGHAGPANQLAVGTHVGAGQVMSSIGPGIVGISTGPHLEIGFCDSSGSPLGPGTAGTMMSLLQSSY
jgi:septal ring factor EnvC (AmiA/AmiB activator)